MKYRTEIDGLRAVSVVAVVIFHFFPSVLKSGYLGVDIFFIISGYLITGYLIKLKNKKIALEQFYARRIKRIFPALFVFFSLTTLTLLFILIRYDFEKYFNSLIAAKTFWANWYFWLNGGYFGSNDKLKPLLHTWSLSVEKQFYLLYPILIIFGFWMQKKLKFRLIVLLILITSISFFLWLYLHSIGGQNPAFFLLPTRAWQFGLGGIIAIIHLNNIGTSFVKKNNLSAISIFLIFFSLIYTFNNQLQTILISIGAALFLFLKSQNQDLIFYLFKNSLSIYIGKISYSLYLYHWPISVIILYYFIDYTPFAASITGMLLSVLLSYASYRYIELPFRNNLSLKYTITLVIICTLFSFVVAQFLEKKKDTNIANSWAKAADSTFRCAPSSFVPFGASRACILNENMKHKNTIVILGNSHAQMYAPLFKKKLKENNLGGILVPVSWCLPTVTINVSTECLSIAKKNLNKILENKNFNHIFIGMTWYEDSYTNLQRKIVSPEYLFDSVLNLADLLIENGKTVSVISPIPVPKTNLASNLSRMLNFNKASLSYIEDKTSIDKNIFFSKFELINTKLRNRFGENFIEVFQDLCDFEKCYFAKKKIMYFADSNHLSKYILNSFVKTNSQVDYILKKMK